MANLELCFSSEACDIYFNAGLHVIQSRWKGKYVEGEALRLILNELIVALQKQNAAIIIADARDMLIISHADQQWIIDDWYPRAVKAGFRYQGLILSVNTFNELNVKQITNNYDTAVIETRYFQSPSEALEWVREIRGMQSSPLPNASAN